MCLSSRLKIVKWIFLVGISMLFTACGGGTSVEQTEKTEEVVSQSIYTKSIEIPTYDASNPEHFKIENKDDWLHINDSDKRIFFVSPNNYMDIGKIVISSSGTEEKKRYLVLDNGNDLHPVQLEEDKLAFYMLEMHDANCWIIDRQAMKPLYDTLPTLEKGQTPYDEEESFEHMLMRNEMYDSSNNIFNRCYMRDMANVYDIYANSNNNVIQNGKIFKTQWSVDNQNLGDLAAIVLLVESESDKIENTKILNMEIINMVDAIQLVRVYDDSHTLVDLDYQGTIIDHNLLYITNILYTDGEGNSDVDGDRAYAENAIDLKGGSKNPDNPVLITNNKMWGFRFVDNSYSNLSDAGNAIVLHYDVPNVIIKDNLIFNSNIGIHSGGVWDAPAISDIDISNNIFHSMIEESIIIEGNMEEGNYLASDNVHIDSNLFIDDKYTSIIKIYNAQNITIQNNTFSKSDEGYSMVLYVGNQDGGDSGEIRASSDILLVDNDLYGVALGDQPSWLTMYENTIHSDILDISNYDFTYQTDIFSQNPVQFELE